MYIPTPRKKACWSQFRCVIHFNDVRKHGAQTLLWFLALVKIDDYVHWSIPHTLTSLHTHCHMHQHAYMQTNTPVYNTRLCNWEKHHRWKGKAWPAHWSGVCQELLEFHLYLMCLLFFCCSRAQVFKTNLHIFLDDWCFLVNKETCYGIVGWWARESVPIQGFQLTSAQNSCREVENVNKKLPLGSLLSPHSFFRGIWMQSVFCTFCLNQLTLFSSSPF